MRDYWIGCLECVVPVVTALAVTLGVLPIQAVDVKLVHPLAADVQTLVLQYADLAC